MSHFDQLKKLFAIISCSSLILTLYLQGNLFSPVIDALISNYDRYNLLNSAILEVTFTEIPHCLKLNYLYP